MRKIKKKTQRRLRKRVYLLSAGLLCIISLVYCLYERSQIRVINDGYIQLEVGEKLSRHVSDYFDLTFYLNSEKKQISKSSQIIFEEIDYLDEKENVPHIGEYRGSIVYKDEIYPIVLNVQDTQAPSITCEKEIAYQDTQFDPLKWVKVTDNSQKACTVTIIDSNVNVHQIGEYTIEVEAIDPSNNKAHELLKVKVVDKTAPVVSYQNELVIVGNHFDSLKGVKAIDDLDGDCTSSLKVSGKVDTQKVGVYPLTYIVSDQAGNQAEVIRQVVVSQKEHMIEDVPMILQNPGYYNGCESASTTMLLQYHDYDIAMKTVVNQVPTIPLETKNGRLYGADPNVAFTGSMSREGYGIYCQPMVQVIENIIKKHNGSQKVLNLTGASVDELLAYVAMDYPVQVWATASMTDAKNSSVKNWYVKTPEGQYTNQKISFPIAEHSLLLIGYDENYVYMNNPLQGVTKYSKKAFLKAYQSMGSQALTMTK